MKACFLFAPDPVTLVYIHMPGDTHHINLAHRFLKSYNSNPPGIRHDTIVVCNANPPTQATHKLFNALPGVRFVNHDDSGWDIGGFQSAAKTLSGGMMFCCGGPCHFRRSGWLKRIVEVWTMYGPGMYGTCASHEIRPHINTNGFAVAPWMLSMHPPVTNRGPHGDRYRFEQGPNGLWDRVADAGLPVFLVTWDGVWEWPDWRRPKNIYRRGDQSNCLTFFKHSDEYDGGDANLRAIRERLADNLPSELYRKTLTQHHQFFLTPRR